MYRLRLLSSAVTFPFKISCFVVTTYHPKKKLVDKTQN